MDYDFGDCVTNAPASGMFRGAEVSVDVVPEEVTYGMPYDHEVLFANPTTEVLQIGSADGCLGEAWIRGDEAVYEPECSVFQISLLPGSQSRLHLAGLFRSSGPPFATPQEPGIRAEPGAYCFSLRLTSAGETLLLERPFALSR